MSFLLRRTCIRLFLPVSSRYYSSTTDILPLAYTLHEPPASNEPPKNDVPLVIMHGLFGSKQNNRSISKYIPRWLRKNKSLTIPPYRAFAKDLNRPVYAVDLRNHGESPHSKRHGYEAMAADVEHFLETNKLGKNATLLGHSMGAKTAMAVALRRPDLVANIIAVDNAPVEATLSSSFGGYIQAMRKIEDSNVTKQGEADAILQEYEQSLPIRQFLLTNLTRTPDSPYLKFRIPVRILANALDNMSTFPYHPDKIRFEKPALFVRGTRSHYVPDETIPLIGRFFPLFQLKDIDAGHWVISEKPHEFKEAVLEFLQDKE
ncbi:hypothetical protein RUND412_005541 [Rhizina undulata]